MTLQQEHRSVEERREQLADAALAVIRDGGIAAATTRAVTSQAGLPHGAFHYCFPSKSALFRAVLERQLRTDVAAAFAPPAAPMTPEGRIATGLQAHLQQTRSAPEVMLAVAEIITHSRRDPELQDLAAWEQRAYIDAVHAHVHAWSSDDRLSWSVPVDHVVRLLVASADGISTTWLADRDDEAADATVIVAARSIATLVDGADS